MHKEAVMVVAAICLAVGSVQATVVKEYRFDSSLEGWSQNGHFQKLGQATASTGEGVAQMQLNRSAPFDGQLTSTQRLKLSAGHTWDTIEFRMRQLVDGSGSPRAPQELSYAGTTIQIKIGGKTKIIGFFDADYYTEVKEAHGWSKFTVDLAKFINDESLDDAGDITLVRLDPIGHRTGAGKWAEIDYIQFTASSETNTLGLIVAMSGAVLFIRHRA